MVLPVRQAQGLRRFDQWPELLAAFIAQHENTRFEWGRFDCALFAADAIHIMTGVDLATDFRWQYATALSATRKMQKFLTQINADHPEINADGKGLLEKVAEKIAAAHGMEEVVVSLAARGDVVLFDTEEHGPALGIIDMSGVQGVFASAAGVEQIPATECRRAWRVG